jgi:hypothetical protein
MSIKSVTTVQKWYSYNPYWIRVVPFVPFVPPFSEKLFSFLFFRGKTLLAELFIKKCLTVRGAG